MVLAVVCLNPGQFRRASRRLRQALGLAEARIVPIGFDPWLGNGERMEPAQLRPVTREAYLRIAALVADPGSPGQWFSPPATAAPAGAMRTEGGRW